MGFPEATTAEAALGIGQFASLLSLEGLTFGNIDGRPLPRLAERWEWESDFRALRIYLRPGVFLHDGRPFNAQNALAVFKENIARPRNRSLYPSLADIVDIDVDGNLQMVIRLSQPSAFLPDDLALQLSTGPRNNIGTGPFRMGEQSAEGHVVLERFDRYYLGAPSIARIVVRPFDVLRTAWTSMLRGEVDMVSDVPAEAVEFIQHDNVQILTYRRWYQFMVAFNSERPSFRSPSVRRALNLAIDRDAVIQQSLKGYGVPATGPVWPDHWAYDNSVQPFGFDARQAEALLDAAGYTLGAARNLSPMPTARMKFTCLVPTDFSTLERIGLEVQKQLFDIGVDMQFDVVPAPEYNSRITNREFDCVLVDMISGPTLARPYIFWRSARTFQGLVNTFGFENAEAERLFEQLRSSTNETAVRSATKRLQRVFLDDPPALFLAWNERTRAVTQEFRVVSEPTRDPILTLWRWAPNNARLAAAR